MTCTDTSFVKNTPPFSLNYSCEFNTCTLDSDKLVNFICKLKNVPELHAGEKTEAVPI